MEFYKKNPIGEFELAGHEFTGFPSNGIWLVEDGKQNCIIPVDSIPEMPSPTLISYMQFQDELQNKITEIWKDKALSQRDLAIIACEFFAQKAGGMKINNELIEY